MTHQTYGIETKEAVVSEYFSQKISQEKLAAKYGIPQTTIEGWILKYKKNCIMQKQNSLEQINLNSFVDITAKVKDTSQIGGYTININGYSITTDSQGIKAIMEAIKQ